MIEVIVDFNANNFRERISDLLSKGYELKGAEVAKNNSLDYPFIYTAILIKKL